TADGGYVLGGATHSFGVGGYDLWLVKTDANGDSLWSRTFGEVNSAEYCYSVQQTSDGGYIVGGSSEPYWPSVPDFFVVKTDSNGDGLWSRTFGASGSDACLCVQQTLDGGYVLGGYTESYEVWDCGFWLMKLNASGDSLWSRTFGGWGDACCSVHQTSDGGYILGATTFWFGTGAPDYPNALLVKADANGDSLWSQAYGRLREEYCKSVRQTSDGGYILAGTTIPFGMGGPGYGNFWLVRTDENGNQLWSRSFGGSDHEWCYSAQQTSDGGYMMAGYTYSFGAGGADFWLVKTEPELAVEPISISLPGDYELYPNWPNPFNPSTQIVYALPKADEVSLKVFNLLGREVATLAHGTQSAGTHAVAFNGSALASGIYFYRLQAGDFVQTQKMVLLK
ncbi:MAG: T9SS type A sorting domain-containing protein, partial [bacterium]